MHRLDALSYFFNKILEGSEIPIWHLQKNLGSD